MISIENIAVQFFGEYLFQSVSFKINQGDKIGVVGPNGSGKTTLLRIIAGIQQPENGSINKQKGISIGYLPQDYISEPNLNSLFNEAYSANTKIISLLREEENLLSSIQQSSQENKLNRLGEIHLELERLDFKNYKNEVERVLIGLGFNQKDFSKPVNEFSGGWRMRIALAKILISNPNLLLLDEPTNHLDLDSLEFLISYLKKFKGAALIVSHDKHFLKTVTSKTLGFSFGNFVLYNGDVNEFIAAEEIKRQQIISAYKNQQLKIKQIQRFIERFRYKATKAKQVQSRLKMLDKIEQVELIDEEKEISFNFSDVPQSGRIVLQLSDCSKSFGENIVLDSVNLEIERGDKIAVVGVNGSGKSTLSKILAGIENIDSGNKFIGHNVLIGYYSQNVAEGLELDKTVLDTLESVNPSKTQGELRTLLGCFLFSGDEVFKQVRILSGGEKSRLALCKILLQKVNFLILDEPTNHLDMNSKQVLQDALLDFNGTILIVSHDVDFLDPLINKVIEVKNKKLRLFLGNVSDFLLKVENENKNLNDTKTKIQQTDQRKLQRRIEAERRQRFYNATKDIKKQLHEAENEISHLEKLKKEIENLLSNPSDIPIAEGQNIFNQYKEITQQLESLYSKWEKLSLNYKEIEERFS